MFTQNLALVFLVYSLLNLCNETHGSFLKPNNVPRVGRSNEAEIPFEEGDPEGDLMGYVIKTNKNIPRMGRRNYDSGNRYDIPKYFNLPEEVSMYSSMYEMTPEQMGRNNNYKK